MVQVDFSELPNMMNDWIKKLYNNRTRYVVAKGGGGSGKSYGVMQLIVYRVIAEPGHKVLVIRKVATTLRESCFSLVLEIINSYGCSSLFKVNKTDMVIECINGNRILFKGLDDPEKIKSINAITDIVIEEATELEQADLNQLDIRLRGSTKHPKQMFIMFNPVSATHWIKKSFFDVKRDDCTIIETNYKDNKFLDADAIKVMEAFKDTDPYYYMVYFLGQWGVTGKTIFDVEAVTKQLERIKKPVALGYFRYNMVGDKIDDNSIQFIESDQGYISLYERPKPDTPYVIGGDTAGTGVDNFVNQVIDNTTGRQIATLRYQFDEDLYACQTYCLGKYYNYALIGIESNYTLYPINKLQDLGYTKMYMREQEDSITHKMVLKYGFNTNKMTRPIIIAELVQIVRESVELINDRTTLEEMLTFVRNEKGRPEAEEGAHDDCIMALAIAYYIRDQQSYTVKKTSKFDLSKLSHDLQQDYNNATKSQQAYLKDKWTKMGLFN
jgi:phage terminase large subunit